MCTARVEQRKAGHIPHQAVGHGLLVLVEVHEVLVVARSGVHAQARVHRKEEAPGVTCSQADKQRERQDTHYGSVEGFTQGIKLNDTICKNLQ